MIGDRLPFGRQGHYWRLRAMNAETREKMLLREIDHAIFFASSRDEMLSILTRVTERRGRHFENHVKEEEAAW